MSKGVKQSIFLLIFLLIASLIFSGISIFEKEEIIEEKENISAQLQETEKKVLLAEAKANDLEKELAVLEQEKTALQTEKEQIEQEVVSAEEKVQNLQGRIDEVITEREKWKSRLQKMTAERDELVVQLQKASEPKVVYKERIVYKEKEPEPGQEESQSQEDGSAKHSGAMPEGIDREDKYWAEVLKEKAELEIQVGQLKEELTNNSLEIITLKQTNADLQIELDNIQREREVVHKDIKDIKDKYEREMSALRQDLKKVKETKGALINNLSLELARTKNDTKFVQNRNEKISQENTELRKQLQQLVSTKGELEKNIVRLKQDKIQIEKQLEEREGMIQAKIQEIWQIKENLDETFRSSQLIESKEAEDSGKSGVDLQPIRVVSGEDEPEPVEERPTGYNGKVISVNAENNFVIVDIGETEGITLGETLGVYRNAEHIATLEVIQIRNDISAADVKEMKMKILQGDIVR